MDVEAFTPLYSVYPAEPLDPQALRQTARQEQKAQKDEVYQPLPWPMEALPGTTWRNLWTGTPISIDRIDTDQSGRKIPVTKTEEGDRTGEREDTYTPQIGSWWENRFCIQNWLRVDHLPASAQLAWLDLEISYYRECLLQDENSPLAGRKSLEAMTIAIKQARSLAEQHGLSLPPDLLPYRTFSGYTAPAKAKPGKRALRLRASRLWQDTFDTLFTRLKAAPGTVILDVPCSSAHNLSRLEEGAEEYLHALFVGETIAEYCESIVAYEQNNHVYFVFHPQQIENLAERLLGLAPLFHETTPLVEDGEDDLEEDFEDIFHHPLLENFADTLEHRKLYFPELGDEYLAHLARSHPAFSTEEIDEEDNEHPEWCYGFWRSCISNHVEFEIYRSASVWICPLSADIERLLVDYAGFEEGVPDLYEALPLVAGNFPPLVFHQHCVVRYPLNDIVGAQKFINALRLLNRNITLTQFVKTKNDEFLREFSFLLNECGTEKSYTFSYLPT